MRQVLLFYWSKMTCSSDLSCFFIHSWSRQQSVSARRRFHHSNAIGFQPCPQSTRQACDYQLGSIRINLYQLSLMSSTHEFMDNLCQQMSCLCYIDCDWMKLLLNNVNKLQTLWLDEFVGTQCSFTYTRTFIKGFILFIKSAKL